MRRLAIIVDVDEVKMRASKSGAIGVGLMDWEAGRTAAIRAAVARTDLGDFLSVVETKALPGPIL